MNKVFEGGSSNFGSASDSGLALRPSLVTVFARFRNLDGVFAYPDDGTLHVELRDDQDQFLMLDTPGYALGPNGQYTPSQVPNSPGMVTFAFLTNRLAPGIYQIVWTGDFVDGQSVPRTVEIRGSIGIGAISRTDDFMNRVRTNLMDDHPMEYEISEPVQQWRPSQIYTYLRESVARINGIGPRHSFYDLETFPTEVDNFVVTGGVIFALYARARLEKANAMDYSDGHTLRIDRSDFYKTLADGLMRDWVAAIESWKKSTPPKPMGLKSQQLPFRIFRVVGMLPNYQSFFTT